MRTKSAQPIKTDYADKIRKENPMNAVHQWLFCYQLRQTRRNRLQEYLRLRL